MNIMLSNTRLFRGIGSDELPLLLQCLGAAQKHYDRGETILAEGTPTEQLGMVLTGMAMIGYDDVWGSHSLLGHVGPGEVFAEPYACIPGEPLLISVTASEDTEVLFLNIGSSFKSFAQIRLLTQGGPANSTKNLIYYIYENAITNGRFETACVQALVLFGLIFLITRIQFAMEKKVVHYQ